MQKKSLVTLAIIINLLLVIISVAIRLDDFIIISSCVLIIALSLLDQKISIIFILIVLPLLNLVTTNDIVGINPYLFISTFWFIFFFINLGPYLKQINFKDDISKVYLLFLGYIIFNSAFISSNKSSTVIWVVNFSTLFLVYHYSKIILNKYGEKFIIKSIIIGSVAPILIGLYQNMNNIGAYINGMLRVYGPFTDHPLGFAMYIQIIILLVLFYINNKVLKYTYFIILFYTLIQTGTRLVTVTCILLVVAFDLFRKKYSSVVLYSLMLPVMIIFNGDFFVRLMSTSATDDSTSLRLFIYETLLNRFKSKPLTGFGFGSTSTILGEVSGLSNLASASHNEYLAFAVEIGLIGLILYLLMQFKVIIRVIKAVKFKSTDCVNLILIYFGTNVLNIFQMPNNYIDMQIMIWFMIGIITYKISSQEENYNKE